MSERTVDEALCRAAELRGLEFRDDYSRMEDQDDLVALADEVLRLRDPSVRACPHSPVCDSPLPPPAPDDELTGVTDAMKGAPPELLVLPPRPGAEPIPRRPKKLSKREQAIEARRRSDPLGADRTDIDYSSDELPTVR